MVVNPLDRHLLVQLQVGQSAAGKPKLHNRVYPHVDVQASDAAINDVLQAIAPLFGDPVYAMGRVDTVQIQDSTTTTSAGGSSSGTVSGGGASAGSGTGGAAAGATSA